ncbi:hypothetical protein KQI84_11635 [bacterium]|nr:hypothetical protein [bacterium]
MPFPGAKRIHPALAIAALLLAAVAGGLALAQVPDTPRETAEVIRAAATPTPTPTANAGPVAGPSPTQTPVATPTPFDVLPPFSLSDCSALIGQGLNALPLSDDDPKAYNDEAVFGLLRTITNYLKMRDEMHSTLVNYTWNQIARGQVSDGLIDNEEFTFDKDDCPQEVSALSFEVQRGDAYLHYLRVIDSEGHEVATFDRLRRNPRLIRHSLPRREVFHLWRPTSIGKIELAYSQANPGRDRSPKVLIHAGHTDDPEYGKSAIFFITRAEQRLRAEEISLARNDLIKAQQEIRNYREYLQRED